ncbi:hypothetical protein J437_LFUL011893 [Ladona fulva]|uniref:C2H2-type domain-containing protein n=1 Tax=Ladona fulva TaxID=123851 RepID=A0A8K0KEP9_LADFU|nr:hypothetical protein J437_LFUL011893 [Ladona fulva]
MELEERPTGRYVKWKYRRGYRPKKRKYHPPPRRNSKKGQESGNANGVVKEQEALPQRLESANGAVNEQEAFPERSESSNGVVNEQEAFLERSGTSAAERLSSPQHGSSSGQFSDVDPVDAEMDSDASLESSSCDTSLPRVEHRPNKKIRLVHKGIEGGGICLQCFCPSREDALFTYSLHFTPTFLPAVLALHPCYLNPSPPGATSKDIFILQLPESDPCIGLSTQPGSSDLQFSNLDPVFADKEDDASPKSSGCDTSLPTAEHHIHKKIRLCLCKSGTLVDIHGCSVGSGYVPSALISGLLQFEVSVTDIYPQLVCLECLKTLTVFQKFKDSCWIAKVKFDTLHFSMALPHNNDTGGMCDDGVNMAVNDEEYMETNEEYSNLCTEEQVEGETVSEIDIKEEPIEESIIRDPLRLESPHSDVGEIPKEDITIKEEEIQINQRLPVEEAPVTLIEKTAKIAVPQVNSCMEREETQGPLFIKETDTTSTKYLCEENSSANEAYNNPNQISKGEKACPICHRIYCSPQYLNKHMLSLHPRINFEWSEKCSTEIGVEWQSRGQGDEDPYDCDVCGARFYMEDDLSIHMSVHARNNPFQCDCCGKKYNLKRLLWAHVAKCHNKNFKVQHMR